MFQPRKGHGEGGKGCSRNILIFSNSARLGARFYCMHVFWCSTWRYFLKHRMNRLYIFLFRGQCPPSEGKKVS